MERSAKIHQFGKFNWEKDYMKTDKVDLYIRQGRVVLTPFWKTTNVVQETE